MSQSDTFLEGEGDNWYERNKNAEPNSIVLGALCGLGTPPASVFEVGCGDGRYLGRVSEHYRCQATGCDPSAKAIEKGRAAYPNITFLQEEAVFALGWQHVGERRFDLIVFGFCLYLIDRQDLMHVVSLADSLLNYGGYLAIHDFDVRVPNKVPYAHKEGVFTYKMDYAGLWLANPEYKMISKAYTTLDESITILKKEKW